MLHSNYIELTRKLIYNNRYGKFDLINKIIFPEKLLRERTKVLKCELILFIGYSSGRFPAKAFKMWICRYRKRYAALRSTNTQNKGKEYEEVENVNADNKETKNNDDWKNFQSTDLDILKTEEDTEPLLVKVIPNKNVSLG